LKKGCFIVECESMIKVENLTKKFGDVLAVDNISFSIDKGEIFAFLGPNGSGKTTTLRMLSALISPTSGKIEIDGKELSKHSSSIRSIIGFLTESPGMYEKISAYENLKFYSSFYDMDNKKRMDNIEKFLNMFGLWNRKDDLVATFSKGMKQKLAIARALIHEPKILFLDEPTSGLDPESAHMVRNFIESLKKSNTTVFLCTHNLEEASSLSNKVCIIRSKIIKVATLDELQNRNEIKRFEICLAQDASLFEDVLQGFDGVETYEASGHIIKISLKDFKKNNPMIIREFVKRDADIIYFNEIKESLEEIYLNLIKE
jgi:ABC-2 type transport system ATP-binding protein